METKSYPPSVILTLIVLSLTAVFSSQYVSFAFGKWAAFTSQPFPIAALAYAIGLCLLPILAIIDIFHAKVSGRYLALFTMMILFGLILRVLSYQIAVSVARPNVIVWAAAMYSTVAVLVVTVALIYRFGFGSKDNDFFGQV
jgi:hypothetical protein